ncbi:MAG: rhodanese-like domain-containing protein [Dissulfurispiraceae bacterium]|jgi:rhodanese-related sulfurtransferase
MKRLGTSLIMLCFLISLAATVSVVYAAHDEIPRITIEELKKLIDEKADIVIYDAQTKAIFDKGHIKGAVSFPWKPTLEEADIRLLPKGKDTFIIVYCDCGPGETDSSDLAAQLIELEYTNVRILKDPSIRGWKKAGYPLELGCPSACKL